MEPPEEQFIYCCVRFDQASSNAAKLLKTELRAKKGITLVVMDISNSGSIRENCANSIDKCRMALILGTKTWGEKTSTEGCTFDEWNLIQAYEKPRFFVKMIPQSEKFKVAATEMLFSNRICEYWLPNERSQQWETVPSLLIDRIAAEFDRVKNVWTRSQLSSAIEWKDIRMDPLTSMAGGGRGGFGRVYRAWWQSSHRNGRPGPELEVAVKVLHLPSSGEHLLATLCLYLHLCV